MSGFNLYNCAHKWCKLLLKTTDTPRKYGVFFFPAAANVPKTMEDNPPTVDTCLYTYMHVILTNVNHLFPRITLIGVLADTTVTENMESSDVHKAAENRLRKAFFSDIDIHYTNIY